MEEQQGKSYNTRRRYKNDLEIFSQYLEEAGLYLPEEELHNNPQSWGQISYGLVAGFVQWQLKKGYAIGSCNIRLFTVRKFAKLAFKAGAVNNETCQLINSIKGISPTAGRNIDRDRQTKRCGRKKATPIFLSSEQVTQLKQQPETPQGYRNLLLICLLVDLGLRCGEVGRAGEIEKLTAESITFSNRTIRFYREKVDKWQTHRLSHDTIEAARKYLPTIQANGPLFYGYKGKALCNNTINYIIKQSGKKIGIANLSPHDLRHTWATNAARNGTPLHALKEAGGWTSTSTALSYLEANKIANDGVVLG